ncbi:hypothetical protein NDA01_28025 [Trichocoleus desertorum AS-A10]|uniref:hypothetical protein n=1 Tax=Trichocoleus desertorum TaxID=1481672 RepID=UPI0032999BA9
MTSPFAAIANATITFQIPAGGTATTDDVGNVVVATAPLEVVVYLKKLNLQSASRIRPLPGLDDKSTYYEGYAVSPMQLPPEVKTGAKAPATLGRESGFFLLNEVNADFGSSGIGAILEATTGTKIAGWFMF